MNFEKEKKKKTNPILPFKKKKKKRTNKSIQFSVKKAKKKKNNYIKLIIKIIELSRWDTFSRIK